MRDTVSIKTRLLLSFMVLFVLVLLVPSWYYYGKISREVINDSQNSTIRQLDFIHWQISTQTDFLDIEHLQRWLVEAGRKLEIRITYVAQGGRVIADSEIPFAEIPNLGNHAGRPEIVQAREQEYGMALRYSGTSQTTLIYVAKAIDRKDVIPSGVLRVSTSFSRGRELLDGLKEDFFGVLASLLLLTVLLIYLSLRQLRRPIHRMISATEAIGKGEYQYRLHDNPGHEFYPLAQSINDMAGHVEDHVRDISEQNQQLEALFNGMHEAVMVLDARGKIQKFNRAFSGLISSSPQSLGRKPLEVIMSVELQDACDRVLASKSEPGPTTHRLQISFGADRTFDVNIVKLQDQQKGIGAIVVFHDITELKRLEKVRQDFVANVSHELRTPLTSIKGYSETLLSEKEHDPERLDSFLKIIVKNTNHMVNMVDDLLQLARLESRRKPLEPHAVNPSEVLMTAWKECAALAETNRVTLDNHVPLSGIMVSAEFNQMVQVFRNLLENGIKYSPPGAKITVACESHGNMATFSVRDEGPGIPRQHQQRIFERFYRIEKHRGNYSGSTGLGLAICRHIVQNYGGKIWVQSPNPEDTKGSTFLFTLFRVPEEHARAENGTEGLETSGK